MWRDARTGLLFVVGPLLVPLGAVALMPLVAQLARGPARRGAHAAMAVLAAAVVAGLGHGRLPFGAGLPPLGLGIAGSTRPTAVAHALWQVLTAHPELVAAAAVLAAAAVALPYCRRRGPWVAAGFGAGLLATTVIAAPAAPFLPLAGAAWITAAMLVVDGMRELERMRLRSTNYTEPPG
jgi:hypothetical protein